MSDLPEGYDPAEWRVEENPDVPGAVELTFAHLTQDGVANFAATLQAEDARILGKALIEFANETEGR